jgi:hypothetical protein
MMLAGSLHTAGCASLIHLQAAPLTCAAWGWLDITAAAHALEQLGHTTTRAAEMNIQRGTATLTNMRVGLRYIDCAAWSRLTSSQLLHTSLAIPTSGLVWVRWRRLQQHRGPRC